MMDVNENFFQSLIHFLRITSSGEVKIIPDK